MPTMSRGHIAPITGLRYIKCKVLKMALVCVGVYSTYIVEPFLSDVGGLFPCTPDACNTGPLAAPVHQLGRPMDLHDAMQPVTLEKEMRYSLEGSLPGR